ncbi:YiaA/YiaB family inner membrane protein [Lysinibacillus sp. KU-BSD001]|uniref:YiaA/YiaB family inner membrane protein n=1 Tax=Lysinibacillus sp. KU-BSD001 TaxID=3141328 RepID=UPI0036F44687
MQQKEFFFLSWAGFLVSFCFVLISIWNNDDWMLVERGFYTICLGWLTYSSFALVNVLRNRREGGKTGTEFVFLTWISFIAAFSIGMIAVYNTTWVLLEKGYYWMGLLFCTFTTLTLAKEIRDRQSNTKPYKEEYIEESPSSAE